MEQADRIAYNIKVARCPKCKAGSQRLTSFDVSDNVPPTDIYWFKCKFCGNKWRSIIDHEN